MEHFTPLASALGGALIGLSAALLWLFKGRIAGISGIAAGLIPPSIQGARWRLAFLAGLIAAPPALALLSSAPEVTITTSLPRLILAGLLVGFGTRLGSGCTSGHGVCGIARLSLRSMVATGVFMAVAGATVFVTRHVMGN
jgi:uncharacterized membrane protein YedE/YeeE